MICQICGIEAPTTHIELHQNIGALVMRFHRTIKGNLCKTCIDRHFREYTLITLLLGWWGIISFFMTPVILVANISNYIKARNVAPVPPGAAVPQLTEQAVQRLQPLTNDIIARLNAGQQLDQVAQEVGIRAGVTPGQVLLYVRALTQPAQPTGAKPADPNAPPHVVAGPRDSWTCSTCGGYIRRDATFCKHCKAAF